MNHYDYGGADDMFTAARYATLDRALLTKEQIDISADTARQRLRHTLERAGASFTPRLQPIDPRLLRATIGQLADAMA